MLFFCHIKKTTIFQCLLVLFFLILFVSFVRSKTPKVVSNLVDFFLFGAFFFLFCSLFKLCISTFDSWKLFVFVFGIFKYTYF